MPYDNTQSTLWAAVKDPIDAERKRVFQEGYAMARDLYGMSRTYSIPQGQGVSEYIAAREQEELDRAWERWSREQVGA